MGCRRGRASVFVGVLGVTALLMAGAGCSLSPEAIRKIEGSPGQEGTGITLTRLPRAIKILATHEATDRQREVAETRARTIQQSGPSRASDARYLAVNTEPDDRSQGSVSVMIWDTQTEEIVGHSVYDVEERPELGLVAMWDTYSAEYVGTGQAM